MIEHALKSVENSQFADKDHINRLLREYSGYELVRKFLEYEQYLMQLENEYESKKLYKKDNLDKLDSDMLGVDPTVWEV